MKQCNVPQEKISTYANNKKAVYAIDSHGKYGIVSSSGWSVEEEVTKQAIAEMAELANAAYKKAMAGEVSPLYFFMYDRRMDLQVLSESMGIAKWRVKRHFKPRVFNKLSTRMRKRYAEVLGIEPADLNTLPKIEKT